MARRYLAFAGGLLLVAAPAHAGRSPFAWSYGSEVNPVRMVEIETWISEENQVGGSESETLIWWGITVGLTDHLELAVPIELAAGSPGGDAGFDTDLERWGGELRYRFDSPDPVAAGRFATLARLGVMREVASRGEFRAEADLVVQLALDRVVLGVDLGIIAEHAPRDTKLELTPGAGIGVRAVGELHLGAEVFGEVHVDSDSTDWLVVGPAASVTRGRFWIAAAYGIGVVGIRTAPRVKLGIQF
jgi:hypothetical protein